MASIIERTEKARVNRYAKSRRHRQRGFRRGGTSHLKDIATAEAAAACNPGNPRHDHFGGSTRRLDSAPRMLAGMRCQNREVSTLAGMRCQNREAAVSVIVSEGSRVFAALCLDPDRGGFGALPGRDARTVRRPSASSSPRAPGSCRLVSGSPIEAVSMRLPGGAMPERRGGGQRHRLRGLQGLAA